MQDTSHETRNQAFYTTDFPISKLFLFNTVIFKTKKTFIIWSQRLELVLRDVKFSIVRTSLEHCIGIFFVNQFATPSCITESVSARKVWVNGWDKTINRRLHKSFSWYGSRAQLPPPASCGPMRWEGGARGSTRVSAVAGVSCQTWAGTATWPRWTATTPRATITMAPHLCTTYTTRLKVQKLFYFNPTNQVRDYKFRCPSY